ncbi:uncharacterized protein LOC134710785 [Mytilus trossulus]|uniref:uncharacterized protein LOC134710785 n=1 Tax=Mytilus trossulus TaxID=6551 RepID=UPI0030051A8C
MARGICILLLVVVAAVSTSGYGSYRSYDTTEYSGYPIHTSTSSVVTHHSSHHSSHHSYHGVSYYKRYHGFKINHRRFSYHGLGYKLRCGKSRFYRLWRRCYGKYHSRSRCFGVFRTRHLFGLYKGHGYGGGYLSYYKKYHGFKLRHNRFFYGGHGYRLRCARRRFYRSWRGCYRRYHSRSRCFGYLRKRHLFGLYKGHGYGGGYLSYYKKYHGFKLRHNRFFYGGHGYKLRCARRRFYRSWRGCYRRYHSRSRCFGYLRKRHLFGLYHGAGYSGHVYNGYRSVHSHTKYSYSYYRSHHGFSIRHSRFTYHGVSYRLKCSSTRFYRLWSNCYDHYHSVGTCFGRLRSQHLFYRYVGGSSYGGIVGGYSGSRYSYSYYRSHHGFSIRHNRFSYHGVSYRLKCSSTRFYRLWSNCYDHYHSVGTCFGRLSRQHLFYKYVGGSSYGGIVGGYGHSRYSYSYYRSQHGFSIRHNRFSYHGVSYRLKCSSTRFYRLWSNCYNHYHSVGSCFGRLRRQHLFYRYVAGSSYGGIVGGYGHSRYSYSYYRSHHGFSIRHNRFSYHGVSYQLKCSSSRFYRLWSDCYDDYHSVGDCFGRLRRQHLFYKYVAVQHAIGLNLLRRHSHIANQHVTRINHEANKHVARISHVSNIHERNIASQAGKHVHRIASVANKHINRFKALVDFHINRLHKHTKHHLSALEHQHTRHLHDREYQNKKHELKVDYLHGKHEHTINKLHDYHGIFGVGHLVSYLDYYKKYHGFKISHNRFSYGGHAYTLKCGLQRFYNLWSNCWSSYHRRSLCFGRLRKSHLFELYSGGHGYGGGYLSYYKKYHGFKLRHNRFFYGGHGYRLRCARRRFYRSWRGCYRRYNSRSRCFGYLRKRHLFGLYHRAGYRSVHSHTKYSYSYYRSHHGFSIRHSRFSYHGVSYRLQCSSTRFYRLWSNCYDHYHSVGTCFGRLRNQHLFYRYVGGSSYGGIVGGYGHSRYSYSYYRSHHGFSIRHNRFSYHGVSYRLKCSSTRFYKLWSNCYDHYHSVGTCFGRLRSQHLFYRYVGGSSYGGIVGRYGHSRYSYSYYRSHHGFSIRHNRFSYHGVSYRLKCSSTRFYRLWSNCYDHYHSVGSCFGRLRRQHLFYRYVAGSSYGGIVGGYGHSRYSYSYYRSHHGFSIRHNRFSYHGASYRLKCSSTRFYRLWSNCYDHYHSVGTCFGRLRSQHLFYKYGGGSAYGGVVGGYGHGRYSYRYYRSHHGFSIRHNRFSYHGVSYQLKCSSSRFYRLWSDCYDDYHSVGDCFGRLRRQHLFYKYVAVQHAIGLNLLRRHSHIANQHVNRINHEANKHVARISHVSNIHERNIASQAGKHVHRIASVANKHINRFKSLVDFHINRLHKHTKHHLSALEYQHKRHLHDREYQNKKHELKVDYLHGKHEHTINKLHDYHGIFGVGHLVSYLDYYKKYHGFKISHNRFSYGGKAYTLKCGLQRFYNLWSNCWSSYHRRSLCFGRLRKSHLFELYSGDYDNDYASGAVVVKNTVYGGGYHLGDSHVVTYMDYYKQYHGFKISHNRFTYGGKAYTLKCGLQRFYNVWSDCWSSYHSRSACFGRLLNQHLFSIYNAAGYDVGYSPKTVVVKTASYDDDLY